MQRATSDNVNEVDEAADSAHRNPRSCEGVRGTVQCVRVCTEALIPAAETSWLLQVLPALALNQSTDNRLANACCAWHDQRRVALVKLGSAALCAIAVVTHARVHTRVQTDSSAPCSAIPAIAQHTSVYKSARQQSTRWRERAGLELQSSLWTRTTHISSCTWLLAITGSDAQWCLAVAVAVASTLALWATSVNTMLVRLTSAVSRSQQTNFTHSIHPSLAQDAQSLSRASLSLPLPSPSPLLRDAGVCPFSSTTDRHTIESSDRSCAS